MTVEDRSIVQKIIRNINYLNSHQVNVGILSSEDEEMLIIASVNEFGVEIEVTDKMRGYFRHAFKVNLRKDTKVIKIPERSFIRSSFDKSQEKIYKTGEEMLDLVVEGKLSAMSFFDALGQTCVDTIVNYLVDLDEPANSGLTLALKAPKTNPLVNSGKLRDAIAFEVVKR